MRAIIAARFFQQKTHSRWNVSLCATNNISLNNPRIDANKYFSKFIVLRRCSLIRESEMFRTFQFIKRFNCLPITRPAAGFSDSFIRELMSLGVIRSRCLSRTRAFENYRDECRS